VLCGFNYQQQSCSYNLQKNASCQFTTQPNLAFPRTRTEPNPYNEGSIPPLFTVRKQSTSRYNNTEQSGHLLSCRPI